MQQSAFGRPPAAALSRPWRALRRLVNQIVEFWKRQPIDQFWPPHP